MKRRSKAKTDEAFLKALGKRIEGEIKKQGYASVYDFWIKEAGDDFSRASLNYIVKGESDGKITTIRAIAKLLGLKTRDLLDFE